MGRGGVGVGGVGGGVVYGGVGCRSGTICCHVSLETLRGGWGWVKRIVLDCLGSPFYGVRAGGFDFFLIT